MNGRWEHASRWVTSHQGMVLAALLVLVLTVWGFAALADEVVEGETQRWDDWAVLVLRNAADPRDPVGPPFLEEAGRDLTALGGYTVTTLVVGGVAAYLWMTQNRRTFWLLLAAALGAGVISFVLKDAFQRPRPELVPHLSIVKSYSFPSGHSMNASAVYLTLGAVLARVAPRRSLKVFFLTTAVLVTFLVGVSRVYMGVHYPTDVLAGWTAGGAWATLCWLVGRKLQDQGQVERSV